MYISKTEMAKIFIIEASVSGWICVATGFIPSYSSTFLYHYTYSATIITTSSTNFFCLSFSVFCLFYAIWFYYYYYSTSVLLKLLLFFFYLTFLNLCFSVIAIFFYNFLLFIIYPELVNTWMNQTSENGIDEIGC